MRQGQFSSNFVQTHHPLQKEAESSLLNLLILQYSCKP
jgi:hypothetical protein